MKRGKTKESAKDAGRHSGASVKALSPAGKLGSSKIQDIVARLEKFAQSDEAPAVSVKPLEEWSDVGPAGGEWPEAMDCNEKCLSSEVHLEVCGGSNDGDVSTVAESCSMGPSEMLDKSEKEPTIKDVLMAVNKCNAALLNLNTLMGSLREDVNIIRHDVYEVTGRLGVAEKRVIMSSRRSDTSSKRKRTKPQKLKSRKLFAASESDLLESAQISKAKDGENQDSQQCLSKLPETLHNRQNVPKSVHQTLSKKESLTETPQNKENMPEEYPSDTATTHRGRGRPKGSKNKTFPISPTRVYSVREVKSPIYSPKKYDIKHQNGVKTPQRGRGRPKGSTKVKPRRHDIPRRSRGRPKGSKNKKPSQAALMKIILGPQKVGRGRPRKYPLANKEETPKRGRGRPKGSLNKIPSAKKLTVSETHEKKKRGRPKKIALHHSTVMPLTPKRPRGRPKSTGSLVPVQSNLLKRSDNYSDVEKEKEEDDDEEDKDDEEDNSDE